MTRTKDDICMLCLENKATKRNSHIISKFIGKSILKDAHSKTHKAYVLDTSKPHIKPKVHQDSPKENHILCPDCEKYFELLETYVAKYLFNHILQKQYSAEFDYRTNEEGVEYAVCLELNTKFYRLFILSLFWRCSITSQAPFKEFKITQEESIRCLLQHYNSIEKNQIMETGEEPRLFEIPIVVLKHKSGTGSTGNFLYSNDEKAPIFQLQTGQYLLLISLGVDSTLKQLSFLNNIGNEKI